MSQTAWRGVAERPTLSLAQSRTGDRAVLWLPGSVRNNDPFSTPCAAALDHASCACKPPRHGESERACSVDSCCRCRCCRCCRHQHARHSRACPAQELLLFGGSAAVMVWTALCVPGILNGHVKWWAPGAFPIVPVVAGV